MTIAKTVNSVIDTVQSIADNPLISLIGLVVPQANSIIDIIRRYRGTIDAAQPLIDLAVKSGEPVLEKVVEAVPKFATVVASITHMAPSSIGSVAGSPALGAFSENVARLLGGHSRMTPEQEKLWMDRMTPGNDPSEENSKYPIG